MRPRLGRPCGTAAATACACLALLLPARPAGAQDRLPAHPVRDATVTYSGILGRPLHLAWLAAAHRSRSDLTPGIWSLYDDVAHTTVIVNDALKQTIAMPMAGPMQSNLAADARYTRTGTDSIAGTACTLWRIEAPVATSTACITDDGVPLRVDVLGLEMTATAVSLAPQDSARFEVPKGYARAGGP